MAGSEAKWGEFGLVEGTDAETSVGDDGVKSALDTEVVDVDADTDGA